MFLLFAFNPNSFIFLPKLRYWAFLPHSILLAEHKGMLKQQQKIYRTTFRKGSTWKALWKEVFIRDSHIYHLYSRNILLIVSKWGIALFQYFQYSNYKFCETNTDWNVYIHMSTTADRCFVRDYSCLLQSNRSLSLLLQYCSATEYLKETFKFKPHFFPQTKIF